MRIIRFIDEGGHPHWGLPRDDGSTVIVDDAFGLLSGRAELPVGISAGDALRSGKALVMTETIATVRDVLAPVMPPNILCAGRNYRESVDAPQPDPLPPLELFMKPTTSVQHPNQPIVLPRVDDAAPDVDVEGELAVVIGEELHDVDEQRAMQAVVGYTIAGDITDRRWQIASGPPLWMRGKGFDTFCPLGPALITADELTDPRDLSLRTIINSNVLRNGSTRQMIRSVGALLSEISRQITILPGTVLLTGAPPIDPAMREHAHSLAPGDEIELEVDGIGVLWQTVCERAGQGG